LGKRTQGFKFKIQEFIDSRIQEFKDSKIQEAGSQSSEVGGKKAFAKKVSIH